MKEPVVRSKEDMERATILIKGAESIGGIVDDVAQKMGYVPENVIPGDIVDGHAILKTLITLTLTFLVATESNARAVVDSGEAGEVGKIDIVAEYFHQLLDAVRQTMPDRAAAWECGAMWAAYEEDNPTRYTRH